MNRFKRTVGTAWAKYAMLADLYRYDVMADYDGSSAPYRCTLCGANVGEHGRDAHGEGHVVASEAVRTVDQHGHPRYARLK